MTTLNNIETSTVKLIVEHATDKLKELKGSAIYGCDLHNKLFNEDYFIIGYYPAEQWLIANGGIFNAINEIKEYEQGNFGTVSTDLSNSEKVCNMYVYILGEIVLQESDTLRDNWDNYLTDEQIDEIITELEAI